MPVGGREAEVEAWRLLAAEETTRPRSTRPLVGREQEIAALGAAIDALDDGRGEALLVVGEHGIGKTRLLEFLNDSASGKATWLEGHCVSYGAEHSPFEQ